MRKSLIFASFLTALVTVIWHLPSAWVGNAILPKDLTPRPQFIGTVWDGQIPNIDGINPVHFTISPLNLLRGKPLASFNSLSPYLQFSGTATARGAVSAGAKGHIKGLGVFDGRFSTLAGQYDVSLSDLVIRNNCESGTGIITTNMLAQNDAAWNWQGPTLSGPLACEDGKMTARLSGKDAEQEISAIVSVDLSGTYRADVEVRTGDSRAEFVLPLYGFEKTAQGYSLLEEGRWR